MSPNKNARIVVIDDNVDAADMFGWLLEAQGYATRIAYSGAAGLDLVAAFAPDVVFCDLGMPCMSGYEFAATLRARPAPRQPLLVAVSGWGDEGSRARTRVAGFDHHLVKPTVFADIRALLDACLGGRDTAHGTPP
jgi:CheY-like chemotaxis protein